MVADLDSAVERLAKLEDLPEDLFLIQGNPEAFDEELQDASELEQALLVRISDRQLRYSPYPKTPLFGRAAREQRIEVLGAQRDELTVITSYSIHYTKLYEAGWSAARWDR